MINYKSILNEISELYTTDNTPWIIGFSGGKDSTTVLQLIFQALSNLPWKNLTKEIHVVCNDTLVENPAIIKFVDNQLTKIERAGKERLFNHNPDLFKVVKVKPSLNDTFWVNLIGRGYPSPNRWFRWCTERLKINPTSDYIKNISRSNKNTIIVLGTRIAESPNRAASMTKYSREEKLREHRLSNVYVYAPIADLSNNEVWAYLLQVANPWGVDNRELLKIYSSACDWGECPFAIETGTQSCGKSRFGCWVCTVVDRDRSMENFINNGHEWMTDLLNFRNWLYEIRQQNYQYVPRYLNGRAKFGPFLIRTRYEMLDKLLKIQKKLSITLISSQEYEYTIDILRREKEGQISEHSKKFELELASGKRIAMISDFDITQTQRKRLGAFSLNDAVVRRSISVSKKYTQLTRVLYYLVQ